MENLKRIEKAFRKAYIDPIFYRDSDGRIKELLGVDIEASHEDFTIGIINDGEQINIHSNSNTTIDEMQYALEKYNIAMKHFRDNLDSYIEKNGDNWIDWELKNQDIDKLNEVI